MARTSFVSWILILIGSSVALEAAPAIDNPNLVSNPGFEQREGNRPANFDLTGDVEYRYLGDPRRDAASYGIALQSARDLNHDGSISGSVSQLVPVDLRQGRWFCFTFRGLPQDHFAVRDDQLFMKVDFVSTRANSEMDGKTKSLYPTIEQGRRDLTVNGDHHVGGAAVWRDYQLDFFVPFPQVDHLRLSVGFTQGAGDASRSDTEFFVDDFSLTRLPTPAATTAVAVSSSGEKPEGNLISLGGRWYYLAKSDENQPPEEFTESNADRLYYHDAVWSTPFAGNLSTWLRAGDRDLSGNIVLVDQFIPDNVTLRFDSNSLIIHTHDLPNHPTGKFPEPGFGRGSNPNYITEKNSTYYLPIDPVVNPRHIFTTTDNSNHALNMGPIGIAVNGVVFFNPFDANSQDASNMMDRCCGHPAPDGTYHYHKYPVCVNSPWADEGKTHSPLIGFAFDGFPIYGPYESENVMAKDLAGDNVLNNFNIHYDKDRGWHYHVTPGNFPYIIGGYWGQMDARDTRHPGSRRPPPNGGGMNQRPPGPPPDFGPPPDGPGR
jgi:hypothetical protein